MKKLNGERKRNFLRLRSQSRGRDAGEVNELYRVSDSLKHDSEGDRDVDFCDCKGKDTRIYRDAKYMGSTVEFEEELSAGGDREVGEGAAMDGVPGDCTAEGREEEKKEERNTMNNCGNRDKTILYLDIFRKII